MICVVGLVHLIINEFLYGNYGDQYSIVPSLHFFIPALLSYACGFYTYVSKYDQVNADVPRGTNPESSISVDIVIKFGMSSYLSQFY